MQGKQSWDLRSSVDEMHEDYIRPTGKMGAMQIVTM